MRRIVRHATRGRQVGLVLLLAVMIAAMLAEMAWAWNYKY